jgi:hypothetical protein
MTGQRNLRDRILSDAVDIFCPVVSGASEKEQAHAKNQSAKVRKWGNRFFDRMEGRSPFQSEEEAIEAIAPVVIWGFGWAARQLAMMVIRFLWRQWVHRDVVTKTVKSDQ